MREKERKRICATEYTCSECCMRLIRSLVAVELLVYGVRTILSSAFENWVLSKEAQLWIQLFLVGTILVNELIARDFNVDVGLVVTREYDGSGNRQQKQLQYMCSQKFDVLLINLVQPTSAAGILNEAADLNIPVILFNREIEAKDLTISLR